MRILVFVLFFVSQLVQASPVNVVVCGMHYTEAVYKHLLDVDYVESGAISAKTIEIVATDYIAARVVNRLEENRNYCIQGLYDSNNKTIEFITITSGY